jgi:hypothetical protein
MKRTGKEESEGKKKVKVSEFIKQLRFPVESSKGHYASFSYWTFLRYKYSRGFQHLSASFPPLPWHSGHLNPIAVLHTTSVYYL